MAQKPVFYSGFEYKKKLYGRIQVKAQGLSL
jgi:hypothetical protein